MTTPMNAAQAGAGQPPAGLGLVLSGGGAKGAYQAGVLRALTEEGVFATHVAGASIGALNGAVVAAAPSQQEAVERLRQLWLRLPEPQADGARLGQMPAYVTLLASWGLTPGGRSIVELLGTLGALATKSGVILQALSALQSSRMATLAKPVMQAVQRLPAPLLQALSSNFRPVQTLLGVLHGQAAGLLEARLSRLLSNEAVSALLSEYLPAGGLPARVPLYVSLYPTEGALQDVMRLIGAELGLGLGQTADSHFVHVQSLPADEQKQALMASAALPLLFTPQEVNGRLYSDGGQGGWSRLQGNTPIQPLLDAGCRAVVVTHLEDGSMWNRHDFQQAEIIEIRPSGIGRKGTVGDVLGFDNQLIAQWMEQGYEDTRACLGRIRDVLQAHAALHASARARDAALAQGGQQQLHEAMQRLREQTRKP